MDFDEDELLVRGLGDVGGMMGPHARRGTEMSARRLRKEVLEIELTVGMSPREAADRARHVISQQGGVLSPEGLDEDSGGQVVGLVRSGAGGLNPAVVTVTIHPAPEGSRLVIRGAAKEGLIKQRAGTKAAQKVAAAMAPGADDPQAG